MRICISNSQIKRKKVSPLKITLLFLWHFFKQDKRITIMNIHEYQGKEILASYGVRVQRGIVANNPVEAVAAAKQLTTETGTPSSVKVPTTAFGATTFMKFKLNTDAGVVTV